MSFDIKFESVCDHRVHLDTGVLELDRRTILLPVPVSKVGFQVSRNGYLVDPRDPNFGWSLEVDSGLLSNLKVRFKKILPTVDDTFQLTYQAGEAYCKKCNGLRVYHDISVDPRGGLRLVLNEEKLLQDMEKGVFTVRGSNRYAAWYGTAYINMIGTKVVDESEMQLKLQREATRFLAKLGELQVRQGEVQIVSLKEMIYVVKSVKVAPRDPAGTVWDVIVTARNRAGDEVSFVKPAVLSGSLMRSSSV